MISFPRPGVQSDRVVLKGAKDCIEMAKQRIQEIVTDLVSQYSHAHDEDNCILEGKILKPFYSFLLLL